jgi:hypothetical protein
MENSSVKEVLTLFDSALKKIRELAAEEFDSTSDED